MKTIRKSKLRKLQAPVVTIAKEPPKNEIFKNFPLAHYSYSSFTKFSTNPFMFKVNNLNGDQIETTSTPGNVIGRAAHKSLQKYFERIEQIDESEAIKFAHSIGVDFLKSFSDGLIGYNTQIKARAQLDEKFAFAFFSYFKNFDFKKEVKEILIVEKMLQYWIEVDGKVLPIPLKGSPDLVYRDHQNRIIIRDHKFTSKYSDPEVIDGAKLIQAAFMYFLVYAELKEKPHSIIFEEVKITENQDKSKQTREFEIEFEKHPLIFQFFYRFYEDVTNALLGQQVYIPNLNAIYDREVAILAYIHRLDINEVRDKVFKKLEVTNITDFLKKKIQSDGAMKQYLDTVSQKFISATTLNYTSMTIEEKIKMKLAEHGLAVEFDSKIEGSAITQYRYEPSIGLKMSKIEAYAKDIEQVVETSGVRILAPIPNTGLIGFEVPSKTRTFPGESPAPKGFEIPIGVDLMGAATCLDLREAPHVLIAGSTGSGKSVCMSNIIKNVLTLPNSEVHLIDPKMVELAPFATRAASYNHDTTKISEKLQELVSEMNSRYLLLQKVGVRNIKDYKGNMPFQFIFIDEFADLIMTSRQMSKAKKNRKSIDKMIVKEAKKINEDLALKKIDKLDKEAEDEKEEFNCEDSILLIAQKGRACGMHIVMATQRPSVDIINGVIKANFPTRMAFRTATAVDSQVIIDQAGSEKLLGKGDMLLLDPAQQGLQRLQSFYA